MKLDNTKHTDRVDMTVFRKSLAGTWKRLKYDSPRLEHFLKVRNDDTFHDLLYKEGMIKIEFPDESTIKCFRQLGSQCFDVEENDRSIKQCEVFWSQSFEIFHERGSYQEYFRLDNGRLHVRASIPGIYETRCNLYYERDGKEKDDYKRLLKEDQQVEEPVAPPTSSKRSKRFMEVVEYLQGTFRFEKGKEVGEGYDSEKSYLTVRIEQDADTQNWKIMFMRGDTEVSLTLGYHPKTNTHVLMDTEKSRLIEIREEDGRVKYKRTFDVSSWMSLVISEEVNGVLVSKQSWEKMKEEKKKKKSGLVWRIGQSVSGFMAPHKN